MDILYELSEGGKVPLNAFKWNDFVEWSKHKSKEEGKLITPEELYIKVQMDAQKRNFDGWHATYKNNALKTQDELDTAVSSLTSTISGSKMNFSAGTYNLPASISEAQTTFEMCGDTTDGVAKFYATGSRHHPSIPIFNPKYPVKSTVTTKLSFENKERTRLYSMLRLRIPSQYFSIIVNVLWRRFPRSFPKSQFILLTIAS